ncbi:coxsackievirus and adenovirus receptor homolog [Thunnus thynnus]|uniref:coxsackievirus and adenovirus receptor homolog n=1 Tax=Thunnus thynnus TaxID=8237 RepID=UPI003528A796
MEEEKKRKMPTLTFSLCLLACFLSFTVSTEITVKPGDDVTLQCLSPKGEAVTLLAWRKPDLKTDDYVFFFRENRLYETFQHPSFRGRVQLRDPEMKDGDVSVILKNVNINDTGTYECRVSVKSKGQELMTTINLNVTDSGHTAGNTWTEGDKDEGDKDEGKKEERNHGLIVGLPVVAVLVVAVICFVIYRQRRQRPDRPVYHRAAVPQQV